MKTRAGLATGLSAVLIGAALLAGCGGAGQETPVAEDEVPRADPLPPPALTRVAAPSTSATPPPDAEVTPAPGIAFDEEQIAVLDTRTSRVRPRIAALVVTELQQLEMLLKATGPTASDRPMLLRRIAEDYAELEATASPPTAPASSPARRTLVARASRGAVRAYRALVEDPANASYPGGDEAQWYLAWEYARQGELADAQRAVWHLVTEHADSPLVGRGYFLIGAIFAAEARNDASKVEPADQAFDKAAESPEPRLASLARTVRDSERAAHGVTADDPAQRPAPAPPAASSPLSPLAPLAPLSRW
jgi:hypothetical protein